MRQDLRIEGFRNVSGREGIDHIQIGSGDAVSNVVGIYVREKTNTVVALATTVDTAPVGTVRFMLKDMSQVTPDVIARMQHQGYTPDMIMDTIHTIWTMYHMVIR